MEQKKFTLINRIVSIVVLLIASVTYLLTIEPTVSFWDCGEFIASSYKLEVGHAPGNPVFQLVARFFTMFASEENAALAVNIMSALCSAFTIFFLYLTIVHLGRRLVERTGGSLASLGSSIAVLASGIVGALAFCWSDTFWYSAVEAEVYAMSSLLTAMVFWMILKWEEQADTEYADRWIVLIALIMGLSIGVHLLNLLAIPAIAFIYYYKKSSKVSLWGCVGVFALSAVVLAVILWGIIPYIPKIAAVFDLLFVNTFGLPFNSGAAFFMLLLLALCIVAIYLTRKHEKVLLNTISLCFTMIIIGYSVFAIVVIRSVNNTPTNEGQPNNPFALVKYLGREQYGSAPLIYGETFASRPIDFKEGTYYTALGDKYVKAQEPLSANYVFPSGSKMLFPRMHSYDEHHISFYRTYMRNGGVAVPYSDVKAPTFADNLNFFFDWQLGYMYMRYFMWNFAGRQNDFHGQIPGDPVNGNWECGIGFIDRARLGDQSEGPDFLVNNKAKNHYYMLPLLLGLIGLVYQMTKDKRNAWVTFLLFFLTGIAIILYLNQSPYQVRERDYAYAGSFYMFCVWIGLAVIAVYDFIKKYAEKIRVPEKVTATVVGVLLLGVPVLMAAENWDDHDRSNRYTVRDMAKNYFISTDDQAILITHGDNDTFPLWYIQEVENYRQDARVMNTSLLGIDWYIDQMQWRQYEAEPIRFTTQRENYLYGTNDNIPVLDRVSRPLTVKEAIALFNNPRVKTNYYGSEVSYIASHKLRLPVNKENVIKHGLVAPEDYDKIVDTVYLDIPKNSIYKPELMILDMLSNYEWDRPIYIMTLGGDIKIGIRNYLQYDGYIYKFVPIRSNNNVTDIKQIDEERMYERIMNEYQWDAFERDFFMDYQNFSVFYGSQCQRAIFVHTAKALFDAGKKEKAVEVLDKMQEVFSADRFPLNVSVIYNVNEMMVLNAIEIYANCGEKEKAIELTRAFLDETYKCVLYFSTPYRGGVISRSYLETNFRLYQSAVQLARQLDADLAQEYIDKLNAI